MNNPVSIPKILGIAFLGIVLCMSCKSEEKNKHSFVVKEGLFNQDEPDSLGLGSAEGTETFTIFIPSDSSDHFSNGAVMTVFKGHFYCQWQSSAKDEDSEDTWVAYSQSADGKTWSPPMTLAESPIDGFRTSGGWSIYGDTLAAYINEWPSKLSPEGGFTYYKTSTDGLQWSDKKPVLMADGTPMPGVFEQDPHVLPDGRIVSAAHFQPGLIVSPIYTDEPLGISGWSRAKFSNSSLNKDVSREIEPSWFLQKDGTMVMVFRDQESSHNTLASVSKDRGESWTTPVETNMPDSRSKQSAGNLPNGSAFIINNPVNNKSRMPLVISLSETGTAFNKAYVLRKGGEDIQPLRNEGKYKRLGFHYPKSFVWDGYLYVSYTTNKEDVEYTKVPLQSLYRKQF